MVGPAPIFHAVDPFLLLNGAVLHGRDANRLLALLVPIENLYELFLLRRGLLLDLRERPVVLPQMCVAAILI